MATAVAFIALALTAGARDLQQAPAPAPASGAPIADLLFVLSADKATFPTTTTLELTGVTKTVQFYGSGASAGLILTPTFTNNSAGAQYVAADGQWLNSPDAALYTASDNGNQAVLLQLSAPNYNAASNSVTFTVKALPAEESALKTMRGVTNELVMEHQNNIGTSLAAGIEAGATWTDVSLFIDENKEALKPMAETKNWWWGPGWGCGWGCGWHGGRGWGRGWGWGWGR